jgi:bzd-type benzoyl-CoA reductase N subunit
VDTQIKSRAFQTLSEAAETIVNPAIQSWKDKGGKVVGYFCSAFPDELVTAAGLLPFRIRATGSKGTDLSDSFFSSVNCSFPRHVLNMALSGQYVFLDGLAMFNSCDNIRRVYDHWIRQMNTPFVHIMSLPRKAEPAQVEWFRDELINLRDLMQQHFDVEITDDRLWEAIKLHNQARNLLRNLYDLRKAENPPITGAEALAVTVAGTAMPKQDFVDLLRELLDDLAGADGVKNFRARLMILGSVLDDPAYIRVIEDQGGLVVTDSLCFGSRLFWKDVQESTGDPLDALAQYYVVDRPSCPRVFGLYEKRVDYVTAMVREFNVDGVILERLAFCDLWGFEQYSIFNDFKESGIPLLMLDREYTLGAVGQLRTRVQAFLETMGR